MREVEGKGDDVHLTALLLVRFWMRNDKKPVQCRLLGHIIAIWYPWLGWVPILTWIGKLVSIIYPLSIWRRSLSTSQILLDLWSWNHIHSSTKFITECLNNLFEVRLSLTFDLHVSDLYLVVLQKIGVLLAIINLDHEAHGSRRCMWKIRDEKCHDISVAESYVSL